VDTQALLVRVRARRDTMTFKGRSLDITKLIRQDRDSR
jgi:hypothetical protein